MYEVRYFTPDEFRCRCGCGGVVVSSLLVVTLDALRTAWGRPIRVTSGRRCSVHNERVQGSPTSRHLCGAAADIVSEYGDWQDFRELARAYFERDGWEFLPNMQRRYIHVAVPRKIPASEYWDGGKIALSNP